jgi:predicted RNA binding protein YcfA (HicA-like mRNA interferase family)
MSPPLPVVSGDQAIRAFQRIGYDCVRQRGDHMRLRHMEGGRRQPLSVPRHRELRPGLLRRLISDAGLTVEEFIALL